MFVTFHPYNFGALTEKWKRNCYMLLASCHLLLEFQNFHWNSGWVEPVECDDLSVSTWKLSGRAYFLMRRCFTLEYLAVFVEIGVKTYLEWTWLIKFIFKKAEQIYICVHFLSPSLSPLLYGYLRAYIIAGSNFSSNTLNCHWWIPVHAG